MCGVSQGLVKAWVWLGMSWSECVAVTRDKTSPGLGWLVAGAGEVPLVEPNEY